MKGEEGAAAMALGTPTTAQPADGPVGSAGASSSSSDVEAGAGDDERSGLLQSSPFKLGLAGVASGKAAITGVAVVVCGRCEPRARVAVTRHDLSSPVIWCCDRVVTVRGGARVQGCMAAWMRGCVDA